MIFRIPYIRYSLLVVLVTVMAGPARAEESRPDYSLFFTDPAEIYGHKASYDVYRNDKRVGEHSIVFDKTGEHLRVEVNSTLVVRYLGIPVYRYSYTAVEKWTKGVLESVKSRIRDNFKKERSIIALNLGRVFEIYDRGRTIKSPAARFPSNHWHPGVLDETKVFHTLHGKVYRVDIKSMGPDKILLTGIESSGSERTALITANRFRYTGGFNADVWYDESYRWVRLVFKADDGSNIEYRCVTCLSVN